MEEHEYRVSAKLLTRREPIFFNRLSVLEAVQWGILGLAAYLGLNLLPFGLVYKVGVLAAMIMVGFVFIHVPVNGLTGLEWLYIMLRFRVEEDQHLADPPLALNLPTFSRLDMELVEEIELTEVEFEQYFEPVPGGIQSCAADSGSSLPMADSIMPEPKVRAVTQPLSEMVVGTRED